MIGHRMWDQGKGIRTIYSRRAAFNLAAFFLTLLIVIIPLEPAFAQSTGASSTGGADSSTIDTTTNSSSSGDSSGGTTSGNSSAPSDASTGSSVTTPASTADTSNANSDAAQNTSNSSNAQATPDLAPSAQTGPDLQPLVYPSFDQSQVKIDTNTGALDTSYPISIPPGRNGLQPNLSLTYNSQNSQQGGIFGEGWSISIPYIERLNKSGVDNLYSTSTLNYFTSSLDGELVSTSTVTSTGAIYIARTENGTFDQYTFSSSSDDWTMTDKNGTQYVFGSTSDSQQSDPNNSAHVYKWMLKTVTDTNNNTVSYSYFKDSGQIYPSSTLYTGNGTSTGPFEVDFKLATTTLIDNGTSSAAGFAVSSNYRVSEIDAKVNGTWARKYTLGYIAGDDGYTTLLGSIAESGENASGTVVSLPSSTFTYQVQTPGWTSSSTWNPPVSFVASTGADNGYRIADLLGNGRADIISSSSAWINTGNGWTSSSTWDAPVSFASSTGADNGYRLMDVLGNGRDDIISCSSSYINTGSGWVSSSSWNSPVCFGNNGTSTGAIVADVNGDGLPAILSGTASTTVNKSFQVDPSSTLTTNLEEYWKLEDGTSFYTASNTYSMGGTVNYDSGIVGNAADFGSSNSGNRLYINGIPSFGGMSPMTSTSTSINEWVYLEAQPALNTGMMMNTWSDMNTANHFGATVIQYGNSGGTDGLYITRADSAENDQVGTNYTLPLNTWTMLTYTYDGQSNYLYVNGSSTPLVSGSSTIRGTNAVFDSNPTVWELGSYQGGSRYFSGKIDEAGIWNKVLSLQDMTNLYNSGSGQTMVGNSPTVSAAYLDNGQGWVTSTVWAPPLSFVTSGGLDAGTRVADVNGDGLPDLIQRYTDASDVDHYAAFLNTGDGWVTSTVLAPPTAFVANNGWDNGDRVVDVNGDGLSDIVTGYSDISGNPTMAGYLNTGHGWTSDNAWSPPTIFSSDGGYDQGARIADVLGDGLPAIISGYTDFSGGFHSAGWLNDNASRADLLTSITYPQGGNSNIQYEAAASLLNASGTPTNYVPYPVYVVSNITTADGAGHTASSLSYQYSGGTYYYGSSVDHQFAGFGTVTQTDAAGNVTKTYYDTSNGMSTSTGQYLDNFWKIGKPYRVEQYDNGGNLYKATVTKWDDASLGGNAAYVFPDQTVEMDYDGLTTHNDSAESFTYSTSTGNKTQSILWGQVTGNASGTFATSSASTPFTTNYTYATSSTSTVIGKVSDETLLNPSSTKIQETQYYYDNLGLGNVSTGNLTKQEDWTTGSTYVNTAQNTYNGYGLITQSLDPRNNTTTYAYDTYNLYPATTTNALSQATAYQFDYSTGQPTQTIDPNKLVFQTSYDGLGRPLQVLQPDQVTTSTLDTKTAYTYTDTSGAVSVAETDYLNASTTVNTYNYYDGLDRLIQTRKSATDAGTYKVTDQAYNNVGTLAQQSLPYFAASSTESAATTTPALFTFYAYDPLGRVLTAANAVGTTTNVYGDWETTSTDPNGDVKSTINDAFGNLVKVLEHNGTSTYTTTYTYDGLKDLLKLTDANGNIRNFGYDGLGRMVSSTDLRAPTSSNYGIWNYTYDAAGNLTTKIDPKNQTTTYSYDALNRVSTESEGGATQIAYTYDSCTNGVGRLCSVSSTDAVSLTTQTFDPEGNLTNQTKKISGTNYSTSYTYDRQGNQLTITNPDNSIVQYTYGTGGLVTTVQEEEPSSTFATIVSAIDYSPMDKVTTETFASGVTTVNIYDPTRLYRLISTVSTDSGSGFTPLFHGGGGSQPLFLPPSGGTTYFCTGAETSYTVPAGVTALVISLYGAQGATSGGLGGAVTGTLAVSSGTTYYFNVGCENGYNGGGAGGYGVNGHGVGGGNGGGMTWFSANSNFSTTTELLVAGGGGGQGGSGTAGSPGNGGTGGGLNGSNGGTGSPGSCGINECAGGGGGGTTTGAGVGGSPAGAGAYDGTSGGIGYGGFGGNGVTNLGGAGGGGGGGGYYGGGGGAGDGYNFNSYPGGGGGGGSSYIATSPSLTATSTASGVNSGDGSITIIPVTPLQNLNQYVLNTTTTLNEGSSTNTGVTFGATLVSSSSATLQLQVEVEPTGTAFINTPTISSGFVTSGINATTSYVSINGGYHWHARMMNASGTATVWQTFGPYSSSTDFIITNSSSGLAIPSISSSSQYQANGVTPLGNGSSTNQSSVVLGATVNSSIYRNVQLQVEVEPSGTPFMNAPNVTSSPFVAPGSIATTTFTGANGSYHWQGRAADVQSDVSSWWPFGTTSTTPKAFQYDPSSTLTANLVEYWRLEDPTSYYTPNNNFNASGTVSYDSGIVGNSADFSSSNSSNRFYVNGIPSFGGMSPMTSTSTSINEWVYLESQPALNTGMMMTTWADSATANAMGATVIQYGNSGGTDGLYITRADSAENDQVGANYTLPLNTWTMLTYTYNGQSNYLYVNGSSTPLVSGSSTIRGTNAVFDSNPTVWELGSYQGGARYFSGKIDEAGIWNKVLSSQEIKNLYNSGSGQTMNYATAASSSNFTITAPHINFTFPTNGTTTAYFPNWQMKAHTVTSTDSYSLTVNWDDAAGDPAQSSTIMASGTALIAGVNVPHPTSSLDYTYDGTPVGMNASATLIDASTTTATSSITFTENTAANPVNCGSSTVQCISYKYDSDGNVTQVTDQSAASSSITVNYTYDSLNRLLSASSTNAGAGQNYLQTFTYDPVGNILSGPRGAYAYAAPNFTDPDSVTSIVNGTSTTSFTYDHNGNLTNASSGPAYTWDYRNELSTVASSSASSTYGYDYTGARMKSVNGTSTIYDPETTYSVSGATSTKNIFLNGVLVGTIVGTGASSTAFTNLTDMLGGANILVGPTGAQSEVLSYYPFGSIRVDQQSGSSNQRRKYIGQQYDAATQLVYDNARYYNGAQGQFLSEDPVFLGVPSQQNLSSPQALNAYSYSTDNPVNHADTTGKYVEDISQPIIIDGYNIGYNHAFLYVVPEPGESLPVIYSNNSTIDTSQPFTLSGEPSTQYGGMLDWVVNDSHDYGTASNQASAPGVARVRVAPPNGMTSAQFDASVVSSFNQWSQSQFVYNYVGGRQITGGGNSNNVNTTLLENAGVSPHQVNSITTQFTSQGANNAPGLGVSLSSQTYLQSTLSALSSALSSLSTLLSK